MLKETNKTNRFDGEKKEKEEWIILRKIKGRQSVGVVQGNGPWKK